MSKTIKLHVAESLMVRIVCYAKYESSKKENASEENLADELLHAVNFKKEIYNEYADKFIDSIDTFLTPTERKNVVDSFCQYENTTIHDQPITFIFRAKEMKANEYLLLVDCFEQNKEYVPIMDLKIKLENENNQKLS